MFLWMSIRRQGLPEKSSNIGPPCTMMIPQYVYAPIKNQRTLYSCSWDDTGCHGP